MNFCSRDFQNPWHLKGQIMRLTVNRSFYVVARLCLLPIQISSFSVYCIYCLLFTIFYCYFCHLSAACQAKMRFLSESGVFINQCLIYMFLQLTKMAVQQGLLQQGGMPFLSQTPLLPGTTAPGTYFTILLIYNLIFVYCQVSDVNVETFVYNTKHH